MNRILKYDLKEIRNFTLTLMGITSLIMIVSYILNTKFDTSFVLATIQDVAGDKRGISIAQSSILILAISLMINAFIWIMTKASLRLNMSITRKNIFKSILLNNILKSLIISIFLSIILKLEIFFIADVIKNNPEYVYLNTMGNIDIIKTNILMLIINNFIIILSIVSLWTLIAMLIKVFSYKIILFLIAIQIILENQFFLGVKNMIGSLSIDSLIDNMGNKYFILLGIITIFSKYLLTYILTMNLQSKGE